MVARNSLAMLGILVFAFNALAQSGPEIEARLLKAIADGQKAPIVSVAADILKLDEGERRGLRFRVRPDAIEFRFRGETQGHEHVEFLLSNKFRDYESLLVLEKTELDRCVRLGNVIKKLKDLPPPEFRLLWVEKNTARSEDLEDVFRKVDAKQRRSWFRALQWSDEGVRIDNIQVDPTMVPAAKLKAEMLVVLRPGFLK